MTILLHGWMEASEHPSGCPFPNTKNRWIGTRSWCLGDLVRLATLVMSFRPRFQRLDPASSLAVSPSPLHIRGSSPKCKGERASERTPYSVLCRLPAMPVRIMCIRKSQDFLTMS